MKKYILISILFVAGCLYVPAQVPILTLLHTNDTHSQLEPFDTKTLHNVGGVERRYEVIQELRKEKTPLLIVDAGDFSQGTPYFNFFKGYAEIEMMNRMGYDVVTLGNHEFDNGSEALGLRLKEATFKVVCANYKFQDKNLSKIVKPYVIIKKGGIKIGVFGLSPNLDGLVTSDIASAITYLDPIETAKKIVPKLRKKCDLVICLSHLGITPDHPGSDSITDLILAKYVEGIDIIVGGHSHHLMEIPFFINNTCILQLDYGGIRIGKLTMYKKEENE